MCNRIFTTFNYCNHTWPGPLEPCVEVELPKYRRTNCFPYVDAFPVNKESVPCDQLKEQEGLCVECSSALFQEMWAALEERMKIERVAALKGKE